MTIPMFKFTFTLKQDACQGGKTAHNKGIPEKRQGVQYV
jgi:hypothetical protein